MEILKINVEFLKWFILLRIVHITRDVALNKIIYVSIFYF